VSAIVANSTQTVTREAVVYPATLIPYESSKNAGATAMKALLAAKVAACPNIKIVLTGYSQGMSESVLNRPVFLISPKVLMSWEMSLLQELLAQLGVSHPEMVTITSTDVPSVAAAIMLGDPAHVRNETFQKGACNQNY
jgi:hypothetical protein